MASFFYVDGNPDSRAHADAVIEACTQFLQKGVLKNAAHVVYQEIDGDVDVGLNLDGNGGGEFEADALEVLRFLQGVADELGVTFIAGTDGEDRVSVEPRATRDFEQDAAFLNVP